MRSLFNGTITFGLINVPIKLHSATESKTVHFSQVHERDGAKIEHKRICPKEDKEVPYDEVVKGYEISPGEFVVMEKDEIKAAAGERSRLIEIEDFVAGDAIDPVYYDKTYYLGMREGGEDAYKLLRTALEQTERVGIGRFVFHDRERLVALRALDGVLALHVMRFHDEVVEPGDVDVPAPQKKPTEREVKMAASLVDSLHGPFKPGQYDDCHREAVLALVKRKAKGEEIEAPVEEEPGDADDLMAALEASLKGSKG